MFLTILRYVIPVIGVASLFAGTWTNKYMVHGEATYVLAVWLPLCLVVIGAICFLASIKLWRNI